MSDIGVLVPAEDIADRTRIVLDYTSRDWAAIRAQLIGLAKGFMPEWETAGEAGDMGTLLLELFAYMGDTLHFYIDRTASEAFLGTAVRPQSVLYIADQLGYVPIGQQAATVRLLFSLDAQAVAPLTLPLGTLLHNNPNNSADTIVFELDGDVTLAPGDVNIQGFASEGITVNDTLLGTSQGAPNTDFIISDKGVIYGSLIVRTLEAGRNVTWNYTSDLALARPTQSSYTTFTDDLGFTHIVFGDNSSGRIPAVNAQIFVTYRFGVGAVANTLAVGDINTIVPPAGIEVWGITVTNPEAPLGGTDPESVESMRFSIPRASGRIKQRAVTLNDYAELALQVPGVAKSIAHGAVYTAVYVRIAPTGGVADDHYMDQLCSAAENYLGDKVMVGSVVYAEPRQAFALWLDIFLRVTVHVSEGYNRTNVRLNVDSALRASLAFDVLDFGYEVTIGRAYRNALSVAGVDWVELNWLDIAAPTHAQELLLDTTPATRAGHVNDLRNSVYHNDLLIPRYGTTSVVEVGTDFPTLTVNELTHDGLWVKAVGGMTNT